MLKGEAIHGKYVSAIYKITNEQSGKVYIGGSSNIRDRRQHHEWDLEHGCHANTVLQEDYNNYPESFRFDVIEYCSAKDLIELERKYIAEYDAMNPICGYNRESGGNKDKTISDQTKKIWSEHRKGEGAAMYGKHLSNEAKAKISAAHKGRRLSEESIRKMAETKRGSHHTIETRMKMSRTRKGRKATPKMLAALEKARDCRVFGEDFRRKISVAKTGKYRGEENKYHKDVICVETGELFHGVKEAGRQKSVSATHISAACKGKRNVAGGLHWRYADEANTQESVGSIFDSALAAGV